MKKRICVAGMLLVALSAPVHAQFQGPGASVREATVAQARSGLRVGSPVSRTGHGVGPERGGELTVLVG